MSRVNIQGDLFTDARVDPEQIRGMVRSTDLHTSRDAAAVVEPKRTALQIKVLHALENHGRLTDEQLERLPEFEGLAPSTVRKRRSELWQRAEIACYGDVVNSRGIKMMVWGLP